MTPSHGGYGAKALEACLSADERGNGIDKCEGALDDLPDAERAPDETKRDRSGFFAIDRRVWRRVIDLGLNPAVTFLVLARGTGGDNATTSWSVDAVERYTGISRPRAKAAIALLEEAGICDLVRGGTKPSRKLRPALSVPGCEGSFLPLNEEEQALLSRLPLIVEEQGVSAEVMEIWERAPISNPTPEEEAALFLLDHPRYMTSEEECRLADQLVAKGRARWRLDGASRHLEPVDADKVPERDWVWLPNALIDGVDGETAPIELVRQTRSVSMLRVFVECYHAHMLSIHGGIEPWMSWHAHRAEMAVRGRHKIWAFQMTEDIRVTRGRSSPFTIVRSPWREHEEPDWHGTDWEVLNALCALVEIGLIEVIPTIYEAEDGEAEIVHPLVPSTSEATTEAERALAAAASRAALALHPKLAERHLRSWLVAPLPRHLDKVEVRGIMRLRYRPQTSATARWFAKSSEWEALTLKYDQLAASALA